MKRTNIYNLVILDESGSMEGIKRMAISGCNETIQGIRSIQEKHAETQRHFFSLVTFNSQNATKILYDKVSIDLAEELKITSYNPNACTPLYDAMGLSVSHLQNSTADVEEKCVLVTVITDGMENASRIFDASQVKSLIGELKQCGWTFAYIGANQDVVSESEKMGIDSYMAFEANPEESARMFNRLSEARFQYSERIQKGATTAELNNSFFEEQKNE